MGETPTEEPIQIAALPGFKPYKQTQAQKKELVLLLLLFLLLLFYLPFIVSSSLFDNN
jgi:hypothetical protein